MQSVMLKVLSARQQGSTIPLPAGRFLIGREEDCHLRPNSELVSRHHCVFTHDEYAVRVRDLGSTNGTFVNGNRVRGTTVLNTGDRITVGKLEFEIVIGDEAKSPANGAPEVESRPIGDETAMIHSSDTPTEAPTYSGAGAAAPVSMGDTAMFPAAPGGYPAVPGYVQQFPQQPYPYPAYPQPMYPGYYMPNMGYPLQGGYPAAAPVAPMPTQTQTPPQSFPEVKLPDPSTTGAKPPEPAVKSGGGKNDGNVPDTAANIIKNYLQRRPAT